MKNCQETTIFVERSGIESITIMDRFGMRFHLLLCRRCRQYMRDSKTLDRLFTDSFNSNEEFSFSDEEKRVMKNSI